MPEISRAIRPLSRPVAAGTTLAVLFAVTASVLVVSAQKQVGAATTPGAEPARLRIATTLVDDILRGLLPLDVVLPASVVGSADAGTPPPSPPTAISVTELRYCGVADKGGGRFRAVLRAGAVSGGGGQLLAGDEGCRSSLARPQEGRDDGVVVADVEAVWRSWELRLTVTRFSGAGFGKPGGPRPLAVLENRKELLTVATAGVRIYAAGGEMISAHLIPTFVGDGVDVLVLLGDHGAGPPSVPSVRATGGGSGPALAGGGNVAAELPLTFANQILRQLTAATPLAIPVDREVIDVQNPTVTGAPGTLTVSGLATPRSIRETVRLTTHLGGEEARVLSVAAEAQLENCAGMGTIASIACSTRNAGRHAAAAGLGAALTQKYQGHMLRDLAGPQTFRFDAGNRRWEFRGDLLHLVSGGRALMANGRFSLAGVAH